MKQKKIEPLKPDCVIRGLTQTEFTALTLIKRANRRKILTAKAVVSAARAKTSPLHRWFEWNDTVAGEHYRLEQARALIRAVQVVYADRKPMRYFVHVQSDTVGYRTHGEVLKIAQLRQSYMHQFADDIEAMIGRYQEIAELADDVGSLVALLARVQKRLGQELRRDKRAA